MKDLIVRSARLLAILPLAALAAETNSTKAPSALPESVVTAIDAADCEQLIALNKRYHGDPAAAGHAAVVRALEDAIFALPACGRVDAGLVRVESVRGVDFFDPQSPLGPAVRGR